MIINTHAKSSILLINKESVRGMDKGMDKDKDKNQLSSTK